MYHLLLEEFTSILPSTPAQGQRIQTAVAECDGYTYLDASEDYKEPAVRVLHQGRSHVVFLDGEFGCCTCADFRERALVKSEIVCCKHVIAVYITGQWTVEPEAQSTPSEEREGSIDWRNAEPIGEEYIEGVGYVPVYSQEAGEAYGLSVCNN